MILPFSTQLNGKPTYFVEKILKCFDEREATESDKEMLREAIEKGYLDVWKYDDVTPKLHTIRKDEKNRWRPGTKIDFFINCRQEDMFRFAPVLPVVNTQEIKIKYTKSSNNTDLIYVEVFGVNNWKCLGTYNPETKDYYGNLLQLAQNDGFDTIEDFFTYFNKDYTGKIIHWTNLRY